jgi:hypothetical protein
MAEWRDHIDAEIDRVVTTPDGRAYRVVMGRSGLGTWWAVAVDPQEDARGGAFSGACGDRGEARRRFDEFVAAIEAGDWPRAPRTPTPRR